ncbi:hypothetical protein P154DRAFT_517889 [Amniculicola lignicola CBS 123094]|uniref:Uncharacterized protein n=1 Tax=Amniculicola lignicola CBS 123094 TaxID=1392246 RepID=A0A6A5X0U0_9PLEO|nr:hypothetical protein P154DRAFT_517889 [Amniculicola lignicola CBS 123094]
MFCHKNDKKNHKAHSSRESIVLKTYQTRCSFPVDLGVISSTAIETVYHPIHLYGRQQNDPPPPLTLWPRQRFRHYRHDSLPLQNALISSFHPCQPQTLPLAGNGIAPRISLPQPTRWSRRTITKHASLLMLAHTRYQSLRLLDDGRVDERLRLWVPGWGPARKLKRIEVRNLEMEMNMGGVRKMKGVEENLGYGIGREEAR